MRIAINGDDTAGRPLEEIIEQARQVEADGFAGYWIPQIFGFDAVMTQALVGREVPRIELGVAVVPSYTRHPLSLAQAALTAQAATGGRFALGIGPSHQWVVENMFGLSYEKPFRHTSEYLAALLPLIDDGAVASQGETISVQAAVDIAGRTPCPVLISALGPKMLELAGTVAAGTVTWMTGPATLESHTIPSINAAAERAGRPTPRVVVSLPVCVSGDLDAARALAAQQFAVYGMLPAYRAMLDREGAPDPGGVAIVGDESNVAKQVQRLADIGVTDFAAIEYGSSEERARTRDVLRSLL